jgi:hypothetical protein
MTTTREYDPHDAIDAIVDHLAGGGAPDWREPLRPSERLIKPIADLAGRGPWSAETTEMVRAEMHAVWQAYADDIDRQVDEYLAAHPLPA